MNNDPMSPPVFTLFAGPNGAGKSTIRDIWLCADDLGIVVDTDAIARTLDMTPIAAGKKTLTIVNQCLRDKTSFCLESTLSGNLVLEQMDLARTHGFEVQLVYLALSSAHEHIERVAQRTARGGHSIPSEDIERRYFRSLKNLPCAMLLADRVSVYTNVRECELLFSLENRQIRYMTRQCPTWAESALREWQTKARDTHSIQ